MKIGAEYQLDCQIQGKIFQQDKLGKDKRKIGASA